MRLGEIKNIIKPLLNENKQIILDSEQMYGGQAFLIPKFAEIIAILDIFSEQDWNQQDYTQIENIKNNHPVSGGSATLDPTEFSYLSSYIGGLNQRLPLYYSIIETLITEQNEQTINIKLSDKIESLENLTEVNKRLEYIFKLLKFDGEVKFKGFDRGTDWYVIVITGYISYQCTIGCLKIAQEYFKTKSEYFKSEKARLAYEVSLKKEEKYTEKGYELYANKFLDALIEKKVKEAINKIGPGGGRTIAEMETFLIKATAKLIKELNEGIEFHLSLNPPDYASEQAGMLKIDYKMIEENNAKNAENTKSLGSGKKKEKTKKLAKAKDKNL